MRESSRRQAMAGLAFGGLAGGNEAWAGRPEEIGHGGESIHQEPVFAASRGRVYEALMDEKQFDKVMRLSSAMASITPGSKPTEISRDVGGGFALFGGYVTGRQLELVPNQRIVQGWRAGSWDPGCYSIARFALVEQGAGTKIVFDHTGFPQGLGEHLAEGWNANYWEPLKKFLAQV